MKTFVFTSFLTLCLLALVRFYPTKAILFTATIISFAIPIVIVLTMVFNDRNKYKRYP